MPDPRRPPTKSTVHKIDTYANLLKRVRETLIEGQQRIEEERVRTYWETGQVILKDILKNRGRAAYGVEILTRLAKDLNIHLRLLQRCIRFAKAYPQFPISSGRTKFKWSHYRELMTVSDDQKRLFLEKAALRNDWTSEELAAKIKDEKVPADNPDQPIPQLKFTRGKLHAYQIIKAGKPLAQKSSLVLDLGFRQEYLLPQSGSQFKEGDLAELVFKRSMQNTNLRHSEEQSDEESNPREILRFAQNDRKVTIAKDELFTYKAYVDRVIDGDTLLVSFDFNLNVSISQKLRLRGIDCPEMDTDEGKKAKRFVESRLKPCEFIIVKTYKDRSDKFDRYLADIFYLSGARDPSLVAREGKFLNQELLDERLAGIYKA